MKLLKTIIPFILLLITIQFIGSSCRGDDDEQKKPPSCDTQGLYYTVDNGQEVFLPQTSQAPNIVYIELNNQNPGDLLMVHQLTNGYIFQSTATDVDQTSPHNVDVTTGENSKLDIFSLWGNTDTVNITYNCERNDNQVNGIVYYSFSGTFQSGSNPVKNIEGHLCVKIDEIR